MPNLRKILASNVRHRRIELQWSQETLAFESELHRTFIAHVESGRRNISLDNVEKIALALGVTPSELLAENEKSATE